MGEGARCRGKARGIVGVSAVGILCSREAGMTHERQTTCAARGHMFTNVAVWSSDSRWIVYDTQLLTAVENGGAGRLKNGGAGWCWPLLNPWGCHCLFGCLVSPSAAVSSGNIGKRRDPATGGHAAGGYAAEGCCDANQKPRSPDTSRIAWAELMARVGEEFPLGCPNCGGDIRLFAFRLLSECGTIPGLRTLGNLRLLRTFRPRTGASPEDSHTA